MGDEADVYGDRLGLLAQLEVGYSDGTEETVGTDRDWLTSPGPILSADLYNGELCDARIDLGRWSSPGYDDAEWGPTEVFSPVVGQLVAPIAHRSGVSRSSPSTR